MKKVNRSLGQVALLMPPLSPCLKDAFEKFKQDFQAPKLPEGKCIEPPTSTSKWYKVRQPCFEDRLQELKSDFAKNSQKNLWLLLLILLLFATPWKSVRTVSSLLSRKSKARFKQVPILKKQSDGAMRQPVTTLKF